MRQSDPRGSPDLVGQNVHLSADHFKPEYEAAVLRFARIITVRPMQVQLLHNLWLSVNHKFLYKECPRLWSGAKQNEETSIRTDY